MSEDRLRRVRHPLLVLHKQLLDAEREARERTEGRIAPADFLRLLIEDQTLAWLRPMTELIVRLDEWLDGEERTPELADALVTSLAALLSPEPPTSDFHRHYAALLQERAEIVVAHGAAVQALRAP
jgi:hypothetical protein